MLEYTWQKDAPLKVSMFAWRLFRNNLPAEDNIFRWCIIPSESTLCSGCGNPESVDYLFLICKFFCSLCPLVHKWLGISAIDSSRIVDHFLQFGNLARFLKWRCSLMYLFWTTLSCFLFGAWRLNLSILLLGTVVGGRTGPFVWLSIT